MILWRNYEKSDKIIKMLKKFFLYDCIVSEANHSYIKMTKQKEIKMA